MQQTTVMPNTCPALCRLRSGKANAPKKAMAILAVASGGRWMDLKGKMKDLKVNRKEYTLVSCKGALSKIEGFNKTCVKIRVHSAGLPRKVVSYIRVTHCLHILQAVLEFPKPC